MAREEDMLESIGKRNSMAKHVDKALTRRIIPSSCESELKK